METHKCVSPSAEYQPVDRVDDVEVGSGPVKRVDGEVINP